MVSKLLQTMVTQSYPCLSSRTKSPRVGRRIYTKIATYFGKQTRKPVWKGNCSTTEDGIPTSKPKGAEIVG
jgi:hypothetical protein